MKKSLCLLLLAFTASAASSQSITLRKTQLQQVADSLKKVDSEVNRRLLNKGNNLLNMRGGIPEPNIIVRPQSSDKLKAENTSQEKLIVNTLLFTGQLKDLLSRPFMIYRDTLNEKAAD
jgi:hypothetical protein